MEDLREYDVDSPETADDHIAAAKAWATGQRSHWNSIAQTCDEAQAFTAMADAATATAHATIAQALLMRKAQQ